MFVFAGCRKVVFRQVLKKVQMQGGAPIVPMGRWSPGEALAYLVRTSQRASASAANAAGAERWSAFFSSLLEGESP
jgi:hypothetical protein